MTKPMNFTARYVFDDTDLPFSKGNLGRFSMNSVVRYLVDHFGDNEYESKEQFVRDLQMAHWSAGSLGLIYNTEINDFLDCRERRADVEDIIEAYTDMTGEAPKFEEFSDLLIFALDFATNEIAAAVEFMFEEQASQILALADPDFQVKVKPY